MADFTPVGNTIIPPNPMTGINTLSGILGLQQQKQALQGQTAQVQQEQLKAQQMQGVQDFFQQWDPTQHLSPDGTTDADSVHSSSAYKNAGNAKPLIDQQLLQIKQGQLQNKQALSTLDDGLINRYATTMGTLADDPEVKAGGINGQAKVAEALQNFSKLQPEAARVASVFGGAVKGAPKGPDGVSVPNLGHLVQTQQLMGADVLGQRGQQGQNASIDLGGTVQPGIVRPAIEGGGFTSTGAPIPKTIPPGFELTEDPITHNKYLWNRQTGQTKPFGTGAPTGGGGPPSPAAPPLAPPQRQIGEAEAQSAQVNTNFQNHQANVNASRTANQQLDQIHNVINLLDSGVKTGQGAQALAQSEQALSQIIPGLGNADSQAAKLDLVNKFLERIGSDYGSLNGSPAKTDAGAESLRQQIGSTGYNPNALRSVMKYTAAQYSAAQAKDAGEQQFFAQKGNGILNQDQYEKQWRNSYDPRVFQLANEPKEVSKAALQSMSPVDRATFLKKYAELKTMGAAPQ